jgi:hypothetical protein
MGRVKLQRFVKQEKASQFARLKNGAFTILARND